MKESDWWMESPDPNRLLRCDSRSFGISPSSWRQPVLFYPIFIIHLRNFYQIKMVGAAQSEFLLGYTPDGLFEIIMRSGKFFFQINFFSSNFCSL